MTVDMRKGKGMTLKILQVVGAVAVVVLVCFLVPILLRLRKAVGEVAHIVSEANPQATDLLRNAQVTLDGVNRELKNIEEITEEAQVLVDKVGEASIAMEKAIRSPLTKVGFIAAGATATGLAVKKRLSSDISGKE